MSARYLGCGDILAPSERPEMRCRECNHRRGDHGDALGRKHNRCQVSGCHCTGWTGTLMPAAVPPVEEEQ